MLLDHGVQHHLPTDTSFPATYGDLPMVRVDTRDQDADIGYGTPDGLALTFFLYRPAGAPDLVIARGIGSEPVETVYRETTAAYTQLARIGAFKDLTYILTGARAEIPTKSGPLPMRWTIIRYRQNGQGRPLIGHMLVAGYQNRFLKIRLSYPDPAPADLPTEPEARKAKLTALAAVNMAIGIRFLDKTGAFLQ